MSLAIDHRPKKFDKVVGQPAAVRALSGKSPKAIMLHGPSGVGKTTLAHIVASENGMTVHEINAADNNGVDAMRNLVDRVTTGATLYGKVMIIIDEAQRVSKQAWDVLLKPMENKADTCWCICTTEPNKIPKTIQTRCLTVNLPKVSHNDVLPLLEKITKKEKLKTSDKVLSAIARGSGGSVRQALSNLELCGQIVDVEEAESLISLPGENKEPFELCRMLMGRSAPSWTSAKTIIFNLKEDPETVRRMIFGYAAACTKKNTSFASDAKALAIMEAFSEPYPPNPNAGYLVMNLAELFS